MNIHTSTDIMERITSRNTFTHRINELIAQVYQRNKLHNLDLLIKVLVNMLGMITHLISYQRNIISILTS